MGYFYLVLAGLLSGGIVFGAKLLAMAGATPAELIFYPNLVGLLISAGAFRRQLASFAQFSPRLLLLFTAAVFAVTLGQFLPLFMRVSVTMVLLLIYLQPLWTILIEHFYFRRRASVLQWFLIAVMLAGLLLLINPFNAEKSPSSALGLFLALLAGLGLSLWVLITKYFSAKQISPLATYGITSAAALLPAGFIYLAALWFDFLPVADLPELSLNASPYLVGALLLYSLLIYAPANTLVFIGNKNIPAATVGMILLLEPVTGITLDVLFLHFPLTWNILLGGLLILGANLILIYKNSGSGHKARTAENPRG